MSGAILVQPGTTGVTRHGINGQLNPPIYWCALTNYPYIYAMEIIDKPNWYIAQRRSRDPYK